MNSFLGSEKTWRTNYRASGRDIWVSAFQYTWSSWQAYPALAPPGLPPPTSSSMIHQTPVYWQTITSPMGGWAFTNYCQVLDFLSTHMYCHDDSINFVWITLWSPATCSNFTIISNYISAFWNWRRCGCSGRFSVRRVSVWNLLSASAQDEAKAA